MYWIPHPYFVSTYWFICLHFYYLATLITYHCEFKNWLAEITELDLCIPVYYDLYYSVVSEVAHSKHSFLFFFLSFFFLLISISLVQLNPEVSFNSGSFLFHVIDFTQLAYKMPAGKKNMHTVCTYNVR